MNKIYLISYTRIVPENGSVCFSCLNNTEITHTWFYQENSGEFGCYPAAYSSIFGPERTNDGFKKKTVAEIRNGPLSDFYLERFEVNSKKGIALRQIERKIHKFLKAQGWKKEVIHE
jgi:hypothetical protein